MSATRPASRTTARAGSCSTPKGFGSTRSRMVSNCTSAWCTSRLDRRNSQGRTHSKTSSNYVCTNDGLGNEDSAQLPTGWVTVMPVRSRSILRDVMAAKFEICKDHAGKFRFHLKAPNGEIIAASQGYETKANAEKGIEAIKTHAS